MGLAVDIAIGIVLAVIVLAVLGLVLRVLAALLVGLFALLEALAPVIAKLIVGASVAFGLALVAALTAVWWEFYLLRPGTALQLAVFVACSLVAIVAWTVYLSRPLPPEQTLAFRLGRAIRRATRQRKPHSAVDAAAHQHPGD